MKKGNSPSKEDFKQFEYEFNECKDNLPQEVLEVMELTFDLMRCYFTLELPLRGELAPIIEKLMYEHYPAIRVFTKKWQKDWIREVAEENANRLGFYITKMITRIENGESLPVYEDFESMIHRYVKPKQPHIGTLADYDETLLSEEQKVMLQETLDESNQIEIEECGELNRLKKEYINIVQPIIFNYFGQMTDEMSLEMWNHYGVVLGMSFSRFNEHCLDLLYVLITKNLTEFPEMKFFEYK